ncbi:MAG: hypothetical protein AAFX87_28870, partial [Bacteroidota bacterium]
QLLESESQELTSQKELLKQLQTVVDDTIELKLETDVFNQIRFVTDKIEGSTLIKNGSDKVFGIINLSKVAFSKDMSVGCYYLAIQCGSKCGSGYVVFVNRTIGKTWVIDKFLNVWHHPNRTVG